MALVGALLVAASSAASACSSGGDRGAEPGGADVGAAGDGGYQAFGWDASWLRCEPPCEVDQRCDLAQSPPVCQERCNPPAGCRSGFEVCNLETAACEPVRCGEPPEACSPGERCVDPLTGASAARCSCQLARTAEGRRTPDSCAAFGKVCELDPATPTTAHCALPGDRQVCEPTWSGGPGCRAPLDCASVGDGFLCLKPCWRDADCPSGTDFCVPAALDPAIPTGARQHCWWNFCARPLSASGAAAVAEEYSRYFQACSAGADAGGTCLPAYGWPDEEHLGLCSEDGTSGPGGACDPAAGRGEPQLRCGRGEICLDAAPDPARDGGVLGVCRLACNAAASARPDAGCAGAGERCVDVSGLDAGVADETRLGGCYTD